MVRRVLPILLLRLRTPLVALVAVYAVTILGFVLIPGEDNAGEPWRMDFFHAFYFVSYMGSTIGFGEIPYPFTPAQRLWATVSIYATVFTWLYTIGSLLAHLQDPALRRLVQEGAFRRDVRRLGEPFYVVCGYGDTGSALVRGLDERGLQSVVVDIDGERRDELATDLLTRHVPGLAGDAADPRALELAGLSAPHCQGVLAVTNDDRANLAVCVSARVLRSGLMTVGRAERGETEENMRSFGTDHVINPFETFADRFTTALRSPGMYLLYEWLATTDEGRLAEPVLPPAGTWVIAGYGRFGRAVARYLDFHGQPCRAIDPEPPAAEAETMVVGRGTEAVTLRAADIESAVGIVAATDDDADNLSIIMTARELNPELFTIARQTQRRNDELFAAAELDMVMQPGTIMASRILSLVTTPLLTEFLREARHQEADWANLLVSRLAGLLREGEAPSVWGVRLDAYDAPAITEWLEEGGVVELGTLLRDPRDPGAGLSALPLLREGEDGSLERLPAATTPLVAGDRLLFAGHHGERTRQRWVLDNRNVLAYQLRGRAMPESYLWRWLGRRSTGP
ncbi:MAG: potassium channel family protein [Pseudomonadota bacterium]